MEAPIVIITDNEGAEYELDLSRAGYRKEYRTSLYNHIEEQNPYLWITNVFFHKEYEIAPRVTYDEKKLRALFEELEPIRKELETPKSVTLANNSTDGYCLYNFLNDRIDVDIAFQELIAAVDSGGTNIDLRQMDCYYDIPLTQEQKELEELWEKIDAFQQCDIVYDMGENPELDKLYFTPDVMAKFLLAEDGIPVLDENGSLVLDESAVKEYVGSLAELYDTYGKEREFKSTRGDIITISKGTYGTTINQTEEVKYLMENLMKPEVHTGNPQMHIPVYKREAFVHGRDDLGNTYIEVDMTGQKLYYYEDGELMLETDVVTGDISKKRGTPSGINYVYNKQRDRILRGADYASPVDYWMPVYKGIGIHDANWRNKFGGEIYKTNGSHGCINVPPEIMPELYDMAEIGTPVIMFY